MERCGEDVRGDWDVLGRRMGSPWSMQPHGPKAGGMACDTELGAKKEIPAQVLCRDVCWWGA